MRLTPANLLGGSYADSSLPWSAQDTVNWIPEMAVVGETRTPAKLRGAPGLKPWVEIGGAPSDPLWARVISLLQGSGDPTLDAKPPLWGYATHDPAFKPSVHATGGPFGGPWLGFVNVGGGLCAHLKTAIATGSATNEQLIVPYVDDYTIEGFVNFDVAAGDETILCLGSSGLTDLTLMKSGSLFRLSTQSGGGTLLSGGAVTAGDWQHFALVADAGSLSLYIGGALVGTIASAVQLGDVFTYGSQWNTNLPMTGGLANLRITGAARYSAPFTPPSKAFPNV